MPNAHPPSLHPWEWPTRDRYAVAALVCGIVSFVICPLVFAIAAIHLGAKSRTRIRLMEGALTGDDLALAGIVLGWVSMGLCIVYFVAWLALR